MPAFGFQLLARSGIIFANPSIEDHPFQSRGPIKQCFIHIRGLEDALEIAGLGWVKIDAGEIDHDRQRRDAIGTKTSSADHPILDFGDG